MAKPIARTISTSVNAACGRRVRVRVIVRARVPDWDGSMGLIMAYNGGGEPAAEAVPAELLLLVVAMPSRTTCARRWTVEDFWWRMITSTRVRPVRPPDSVSVGVSAVSHVQSSNGGSIGRELSELAGRIPN